MADWQPVQYLKYRDQRTQPSIDLVNRINQKNPARIIDIGCGPGNSTNILKERWPDADIYGLDNSENMIKKAVWDYPEINWILSGAGDDLSQFGKFDLVFSNAALQWMPGHEVLIANLFNLLNENGTLAVQVPWVKHLPIYGNIQTLIGTEKWSGYFAEPPVYPKHFALEHYYNIISQLTDHVEFWQTDYIHIFPDHDGIVEWYKGSGLRPFLEMLPDEKLQADFCDDYRRLITETYPKAIDGKVMMPFTRIFFITAK